MGHTCLLEVGAEIIYILSLVGVPGWIGHGIKTCKYITIEIVKPFQTVMPLDPSGLTKAFFFLHEAQKYIHQAAPTPRIFAF